jgi:site-specific DNA-methyltransferase (adenine-specific)
MTPYLTTCRGALFAGDCLEVLANLKSKTIDCVFADPPFNLGKDYKNSFNDRVAEVEYISWCERWISECTRVLKPGGAFFIYALPELAVHFGGILNRTLTFRHWIAITMKGTYPRGRKLYPAHYALLYYTRGEPKTFNRVRLPIPTCRHCGGEIKDYGGHRDKMNPEGVNLTDFWEDTSPNRHRKFKVRPGVNELKLIIPQRAILISTQPRDVVLDPFGGGGSTFQVAEETDRNWIGVELHDCEHIAKRLSQQMPISFGRAPRFAYHRLFRNNENHEHPVLRRRERESLQARAG